MLTQKLTVIAEKLRQTGVFGHVFPLVRIVSTVQDGKVRMFPAAYSQDAQFHHVLHDSAPGVVYFRINGEITPAIRRMQLTSCSDDVSDLVYPLRQVVCISRQMITDCQNDEHIMLWMIEKTQTSGLVLQSITLDPVRVLSGEYSNYSEFVDINYEYAYMAIDWMAYISVQCICN